MVEFNVQAALVKKIDDIAASERITKQLLSELSRELLTYVPDTNDVGMVNRLNSVLTPMNKRVSLLFFNHFLPWSMDDTGSTFLGKDKSDKRYAKKIAMIEEALADPEWDIWVWAEDNVEVEKKEFNLADNLVKAVELAVKGKEESKKTLAADPLSIPEILACVMSAGVKFEDILDVITAMDADQKEPEKQETANAA